MAKIHIVKSEKQTQYFFFCPGCKIHHAPNQSWSFNGDLEKPTFNPSILVRSSTHHCHSFVRNGVIEFLSDCKHDLAGKTVEIPDFDNFGQE